MSEQATNPTSQDAIERVERLLVREWGTPDMSFRGWSEIRDELHAMWKLAFACEEYEVASLLEFTRDFISERIAIAINDEYRERTASLRTGSAA